MLFVLFKMKLKQATLYQCLILCDAHIETFLHVFYWFLHQSRTETTFSSSSGQIADSALFSAQYLTMIYVIVSLLNKL